MKLRGAILGMVVLTTLAAVGTCEAQTGCAEDGPTSLDAIATRVQTDGVKFVFVGENHGVGPIKRFVVDLSNALVERGLDVGLYVEGFRTHCPPSGDCWSLARAFNVEAYRTLLEESVAVVRPLDPMGSDDRTDAMAATLAKGPEPVKVVLVGNAHVVHAEDPHAKLWVFEGRRRYPDPGDLAEAFPRQDYLTVGLETAESDMDQSYTLRHDGCALDYVVTTNDTPDY